MNVLYHKASGTGDRGCHCSLCKIKSTASSASDEQNRQVFTAVDIYDIRLTFKQIAIASEEFFGSPLSFNSKATGIFLIKKR
jgi:hypothetical protein